MDKSIDPVNQIATRSSTCYEFSNSNPAEIVEIEDDPVKTVERQIENSKLNHKFNEEDVPKTFKSFMNNRISNLKVVQLVFNDSTSLLIFDDSEIRFKNKNSVWTITYKELNTTIKTIDPEKSIIDHLWFVLKNPNIKLKILNIIESEDSKAKSGNRNFPREMKIDSKKLYTLLQSMLNSIDHQIETIDFAYEGLNEDALLSMLKHVKPGTLEDIIIDFSIKEEENCQKMKEIVETDQWKQAKTICSRGVTPFKIDDFFHCDKFWLELDSVTPEDVLRVVENAFNASSHKYCRLTCKNIRNDIDAIIDFLRSQIDGSRINKAMLIKFAYDIVKSGKRVLLVFDENNIAISRY